jgi:phenylacetate-CoA ligase
LARFLEREGISDITPKGILSAGMILHPWERKKIEEVFRTRIQDRYGCEELGLIATECKEQQGLHINTDCHYVEFLGKDGSAVAPGEAGQIVITDLTNRAMPFIRYRLEDVCIPTDERCPCGRTQPMIKRIEGRVADFLVTPEGKLVSGISLTDHFAGYIPGIDQIQIIQELTDLLIFRIVRERTYGPESENAIQRLVGEYFGPAMRYQLEFLDAIPREARGKFRFTICKVQHRLLG